MEEEENLGGIGVSFGQGEEVEIVVSDIEILLSFSHIPSIYGNVYIDSLIGEARWDG